MKRNMIILVSVLLAVTLAVGGSIAMANPNGTLIDKELSADEASLGDRITVTLNVTDGVMGQAVVDTLPDPLKYINGTLNVTGGNATCVTSEGEIACTLAENATYTITFDVQVTSTEAGNITVTNNATVANLTASAELLITPYEGFTKKVVNCTEADAYNVTIETDVDWWVELEVLNVPGDNITTMEDVVVKDRLGGDLELLEVNGAPVTQPANKKDSDTIGNVTVMWTGKTLKAHITWDVGDLDEGDGEWQEIRTPGVHRGWTP